MALKCSAICRISVRASRFASTLTRAISVSYEASPVWSVAWTTSTSFDSCLIIWTSVPGSPEQVMVMREKSPRAAGLTTRLSML